jgi:hypothetical protein
LGQNRLVAPEWFSAQPLNERLIMAEDSDYYGGDPGESSDDPPEKQEEGTEGETSLLPKSMFGKHEPKVGEEYVFKVVRLHEGEAEIAYATGEEKDKEKSGMADSMDEMDGMASETSAGGY